MRDALLWVLKSRWVIADFLFFQYISILELLGSVDMMSRNLPYRKYRPMVQVHKNAYIWSEHGFSFWNGIQWMKPYMTFCLLCVSVYVAGGGMWSRAFWRSMWNLDSKCGHGSTSNATGRWWNVTESSTSPKSPARNPARSCSRRWRWDRRWGGGVSPAKLPSSKNNRRRVRLVQLNSCTYETVIKTNIMCNSVVTFFTEHLCSVHAVDVWAAITSLWTSSTCNWDLAKRF